MMSKAGAASGGVRGERWWVGLIPFTDGGASGIRLSINYVKSEEE